ncbi:MAG TPA: hypothetical protein VM933_05690 [Acidimicrobiales bacterium]|nr:hypothetical protein [Acidimicrobiales bacterium]
MASRVRADRRVGSPYLVGVAGAVAVGKSTFAKALAAALDPVAVEVVATDGFLRPNAELAAEGLLAQKGFPASYDVAALTGFLDDLRAGRLAEAPVYSHVTYDRVPGEARRVDAATVEVLVLEGVNALQPAVAERLDLRVYVDADEPLVRSWYVQRFLEMIEAAEADEASFYRGFVALDPEARRSLADSVWEGVNLVNLTEHILPTREHADLVLAKVVGHRFS